MNNKILTLAFERACEIEDINMIEEILEAGIYVEKFYRNNCNLTDLSSTSNNLYRNQNFN